MNKPQKGLVWFNIKEPFFFFFSNGVILEKKHHSKILFVLKIGHGLFYHLPKSYLECCNGTFPFLEKQFATMKIFAPKKHCAYQGLELVLCMEV
jgi:hypothetical protein